MKPRIAREVVASVAPADRSPAQIAREFRAQLDAGAELLPAGTARRRPRQLLEQGYTPKHKLQLFDATYYLTNVRQNEDIRFFVAYVQLGAGTARGQQIFPRIFYKDISLTWRSASHYIRSNSENWIGKGDTRIIYEGDHELVTSDEGTTDLPLEIQSALETICRWATRIRYDEKAVALILRRAPDHRIEPYADFTGPRRRAASDPRNLVYRGQAFARFKRPGDPTSLEFAKGYEPDFDAGVVERSSSRSRIYGGALRRYRIVSKNREVQYYFVAGPKQVWIASLQATTTEIMSFGLRTVDAVVDDDLLVPAYEYHFLDEDEDPPVWVTQIPEGYAGQVSPHDPYRVDASPWLDKMPVIRDFRRKVLGRLG
ncbi:MAG: hypothetical protein JRG92_20770 [Deltaproteobacteria bacterium]|nr:hypothetical protein [Deltaproteobacteria bacterium]